MDILTPYLAFFLMSGNITEWFLFRYFMLFCLHGPVCRYADVELCRANLFCRKGRGLDFRFGQSFVYILYSSSLCIFCCYWVAAMLKCCTARATLKTHTTGWLCIWLLVILNVELKIKNEPICRIFFLLGRMHQCWFMCMCACVC